MSETIGFIGLGSIGLPIARRLLQAGYTVRLQNRTAEKARALAEEAGAGAVFCETPAEAAQGASVVVTMLADDAALEQVTTGDEGILTTLAPDTIHLSLSTVGPDTSRRLSALHDLHDSHYVAAPVFGRPAAAAAGKLNIAVSGGDSALRERVRPILDAMGQRVFDFGDDPGAANVVKLCGNFLIFAATEALAEAYTLAEKSGVERAALNEMLTQTVFACPVYQNYGALVVGEDYSAVGFSLALGLKDMRLVADTGRATMTPLPLIGLIDEKITASLAKGRGHLDAAAFALEASEAAGLKRDGTGV